MSDPTSDPLIAPRISKLSAQLKAGKLTPEERAKPYPVKLSTIPDALLPFIESPRLEKLAEVLKAHPRLYWHPLVARQILHLLRLVSESGKDAPQGGAAVTWLKALAEAHVNGLRLGKRIKWKAPTEKRGRKNIIENPYPAMAGDEWIDPATLEREFCALRLAFEEKVKQAKGKASSSASSKQADIKKRRYSYRRLVQEVLKQSDIEWSGLRYQFPESVATSSTGAETAELFWSEEDFADPEPWESLELKLGANILKTLEAGKGRRLKRESDEAYLAYVALGALLKAEPKKVRDKIENYRKYLRKKASKRS